ncbi:MAG: aminotransferase class V-fold PLP-dependent enzyme [Planctomycetaceae bacterium]
MIRNPRLTRRETLLALGGTAAGLALAAPAKVSAAAPSGKPADWNQIRSQFQLDPEIAFLNTGSLGATPQQALDAIRAATQRIEVNPVAQGFGDVLNEAEKSRQVFADLLACKLDEVLLTRNTTDGMNLVAEGLDLKPGDHVLTSDHEHGGGRRCWEFLAKKQRVIIDKAEIPAPPESADQIVDRFKAAMTPKTRVISVSVVTFSSGVQTPIARLSELAHKHKCLLVADGAQSTGALPINVKELGCDAYATSGHKWLLGPKGTGLLYISERAREQITPMRLDDGFGVYTAIGGTIDAAAVLGLAAAVQWANSLGQAAVHDRIMRFREQLYAALAAQKGVTINSPPPGSPLASHLVCFTIKDQSQHAKVNEQFAKDKIVIKTVHHGGIDFRTGCHVYNRPEDVDRLASSLRTALG